MNRVWLPGPKGNVGRLGLPLLPGAAGTRADAGKNTILRIIRPFFKFNLLFCRLAHESVHKQRLMGEPLYRQFANGLVN
jgi:hypothetical protein